MRGPLRFTVKPTRKVEHGLSGATYAYLGRFEPGRDVEVYEEAEGKPRLLYVGPAAHIRQYMDQSLADAGGTHLWLVHHPVLGFGVQVRRTAFMGQERVQRVGRA